MALQATHIKFALDLKEKYKPKNLKKYISGAVYPDSRYVTGLNRDLTHGTHLLNMDLTDDFKKGWHSHLVCDNLLGIVMDKILPNKFNRQKNVIRQGNQYWLNVTAIKILLEIYIFKTFNIQRYLIMLDYIENPYNEDFNLVKKSNYIIQLAYKNKTEINLNHIINYWRGLIPDIKMLAKIQQTTLDLMRNRIIIKDIEKLYSETLKLANKNINKLKNNN